MAGCEKRDMKGRGRLMISRIGCRIILSIGCVLGNVASNWVREGEGGGVLCSPQPVRPECTHYLLRCWAHSETLKRCKPWRHQQVWEKMCLKQVKSEKRTGMDGPLYVIGTVGIVETLVVSHESHCTIIDILRIWMFDSLANKITAVILWLDIAANFRFLHSTVRVHSDGGADHYSGPLISILETFIVSSW